MSRRIYRKGERKEERTDGYSGTRRTSKLLSLWKSEFVSLDCTSFLEYGEKACAMESGPTALYQVGMFNFNVLYWEDF